MASEGCEIKTRRKTYLYSTAKFACLPNNSVACSRLLFGLEKTKEPIVEEIVAPNLGAEEVAAASDVEPGAWLSEFPSREDAQGPIFALQPVLCRNGQNVCGSRKTACCLDTNLSCLLRQPMLTL